MLADLLDKLELLNHVFVVLANGNVFDVDEDLLDRYVATTSDS